MAIIDIATAKALIGITGQDENSKVSLLCDAADSAIKRYLGRDIERQTYPGTVMHGRGDSGYYSGNGSRYLVLRQRPVISVTSIHLDHAGNWGSSETAFPAESLLVAGRDYALVPDGFGSYRGVVERLRGVWVRPRWYRVGEMHLDPQTAQGNIKIAYTAGYDPVPPDLTQAAALLIAHWRRIGDKGGTMQSESLGGYSYSMAAIEGGMPAEVKMLLARYREARFA